MLILATIILAADLLALVLLLNRQKKANQQIMKTQSELAADLAALTTQTNKIAAEQGKRFDDLTAVIVKLTEQINAGEVTPEVQASLAELQTKLQSLDDSIPDATA